MRVESRIVTNLKNRLEMTQSPILDNALVILVVSRALGALVNIVHDCDEVFNYWEPLHYILYGYGAFLQVCRRRRARTCQLVGSRSYSPTRGRANKPPGMQTWEYSAAYALRSWWYIVLHKLLGWPLAAVLGNRQEKVVVFYIIKTALGMFSAWSECLFCDALAKRVHPHVGKLYLVLSAFSSGMLVSANAFLPSSFAMVAMTFSAAGVLRGNPRDVILGAVVGTTWGWIVAGLAFVPYAVWVLLVSLIRAGKSSLSRSFAILFMSLAVALAPLMACDRFYYGTWKASLINFLEYNVQGGGKSDLYGVEPPMYYLRNGFNQLQMVLPLALLLPIVLMVRWVRKRDPVDAGLAVAVSPAFLWLASITALPHKEERFLYVVYPLLIASAAATTVRAKEVLQAILPTRLVQLMVATGILGTCALSLSRSYALVHGYGSMMSLYTYLPSLSADAGATVVCTGAEWYKFPSSFFLPGPVYRLQFVRSSFDGLLPRPFAEEEGGTRLSPPGFNDENKMESANFWDDAARCDYFVTTRRPAKGRDGWEWYDAAIASDMTAKGNATWIVQAALPYIDSAVSPAWSRAFSIPFVTNRHNSWLEYVLLRRKLK